MLTRSVATSFSCSQIASPMVQSVLSNAMNKYAFPPGPIWYFYFKTLDCAEISSSLVCNRSCFTPSLLYRFLILSVYACSSEIFSLIAFRTMSFQFMFHQSFLFSVLLTFLVLYCINVVAQQHYIPGNPNKIR